MSLNGRITVCRVNVFFFQGQKSCSVQSGKKIVVGQGVIRASPELQRVWRKEEENQNKGQ